jgi:heme o synthase
VKSVPAAVAPVAIPSGRIGRRMADYVALTKPRLNFLVVATSAAGYYLGAPARVNFGHMVIAVLGTALVAGGSAVLNQVYERDTDGLMRRTRLRPLPDHRVDAGEARVYGLVLSAGGILLLAARINALAAALAVLTLVTYLVIYTPMKRRSPASTLVGAVPGALPPLIGWAASAGTLSVGGWSLFAIVFFWQIPHFMAIAWLYREDYGRAGFPMLPVIEPDGRRTGKHAVLYSAALVPVSLLPTMAHVSGPIYFCLALVLGLGLLTLALRFASTRSESAGRALFFGSITYLPLVWIAMIANKV